MYDSCRRRHRRHAGRPLGWRFPRMDRVRRFGQGKRRKSARVMARGKARRCSRRSTGRTQTGIGSASRCSRACCGLPSAITGANDGAPVLPRAVRVPWARGRDGLAASGWSHARRGLPDRSGVAECTRYGASTRGAGPARPARPSPGGPGRVHAPSGSRIGEFPAVLVSGCALAPSDPRSGSDASRKAGCERARLARSPIRAGRRARVVFTGGGSERGCDV